MAHRPDAQPHRSAGQQPGDPQSPHDPSSRSTRLAARARNLFWRGVCGLVGGRRVSGLAPTGPAVVVANHSSHADTALLLATLRPEHRPVMAAAFDYWFAVPWRRWVLTTLVGAVPVRRDGHGDAYGEIREAVRPLLQAGGQVVLFPEGTRSGDGQVGQFRSGALRLARDLQVPLVPVGLSGTDLILPKRGGGVRPMGATVRIGAPVVGAELETMTAEQLRDRVCALRDGPEVPWVPSPLWTLLDGVDDKAMMAAGFGWGFTEALSWPLMAEMFVNWFAVPTPRRMLRLGVAVAAGSATGAVTHALLARRGVRLPAPMTTPRMHAAAAADLAESPWLVRKQAFNGIPVKVYSRAAGESDVDLLRYAAAVTATRAARIVGATAAVYPVAKFLKPLTRHRYGGYLAVTGVVFTVALRRVIRRWE